MPIVRVGGSDAESFDVAEMTDHQYYSQQRNRASPQPQSDGISLCSAKILSPMPEIDDSTSTISSRAGSTGPHGIKGSILVYTNSNHGTTTSLDKQLSRNSFSNMPLYEAVEKNYDMQHDPRNPFLKNPRTGHPFIQEEDETSLSTMDDPFIPPCIGQQSSNNPTQQSWMHSHQKIQSHPRSYRNRPKYQSSSQEPVDDVPSIPSNQGSKNCQDNKNDQKSAQSISALESLVAKLNFELATTKSSLDELKLENRNLQQDKTSLSATLTKLQKENDRLRVHIVRLEKEKLLRNIEGTRGVARPTVDLCLEWSDMSVSDYKKWSKPSDASAASSNRVSVPTLNLDNNGDGSVDALSGKKFRTSSYEFHDSSSASGDDSDSAVSIKFCGSNSSLDGSHKLINYGQETKVGKGGLNFLNIFGGGKTEEASKIPRERLTSNQRGTRAIAVEESGNRNDAQKVDDDSNYDDPFKTWSAPGDIKRHEQEQNWLQRGFGGRRKDSKQLRPCPQSNGMIEPLNSCKGDHQRDEKLQSLGCKVGTASRGGDSNIEPALQEKSSGFFKGLGKGR